MKEGTISLLILIVLCIDVLIEWKMYQSMSGGRNG